MEHYTIRRIDYTKLKQYINRRIEDITCTDELSKLLSLLVNNYTSIKLRSRSHGWLTKEILKAIKNKNKQYKKFTKTGF